MFRNHIASYVINLNRRQDRLAEFLNSWRNCGYGVELVRRIEAVLDSNFGGLGCTKSHIRALSKYITESELPYCAVFEDDFVFRVDSNEIERVLALCNQQNPDWDVFLLGGTFSNMQQGPEEIKRVIDSQSCSGYIIRRAYVPNILDVLARSVSPMEYYRHDARRNFIYSCFAADQVWKVLQRRDRWFCTSPMLGMQRPSYSDIQKGFIDLGQCSS